MKKSLSLISFSFHFISLSIRSICWGKAPLINGLFSPPLLPFSLLHIMVRVNSDFRLISVSQIQNPEFSSVKNVISPILVKEGIQILVELKTIQPSFLAWISYFQDYFDLPLKLLSVSLKSEIEIKWQVNQPMPGFTAMSQLRIKGPILVIKWKWIRIKVSWNEKCNSPGLGCFFLVEKVKVVLKWKVNVEWNEMKSAPAQA